VAAPIQEDNAGTLSLICVPLASRGRDGERAADPLHRAGIDAKTLGDATHTFASAGRQDSALGIEGLTSGTHSLRELAHPGLSPVSATRSKKQKRNWR
jgi:hypothetical protein